MHQVSEMDKAVQFLYLELPVEIADDVQHKWSAVKGLLNSQQEVQECDANTPDQGTLPLAPNSPKSLEELRELFFKECVVREKDELKWDLFVNPQLLFNWFKPYLSLSKEK
jgi:hypothetical protein